MILITTAMVGARSYQIPRESEFINGVFFSSCSNALVPSGSSATKPDSRLESFAALQNWCRIGLRRQMKSPSSRPNPLPVDGFLKQCRLNSASSFAIIGHRSGSATSDLRSDSRCVIADANVPKIRDLLHRLDTLSKNLDYYLGICNSSGVIFALTMSLVAWLH